MFPSQLRDINSPGFAHESPSPEPPRLVPFNAKDQRLCSEPLANDWAPHPISKSEHRHPSEEAQFCHFSLVLSISS